MLLGGEEKPTLVQNLQVLSPFSYFCPVDVSAKKSVMGNQENRHQVHRKHWMIYINQPVILCWSWFNTFTSIEKRCGRDDSGSAEELCMVSGKYFLLRFVCKNNTKWIYIVAEKYTCTVQLCPKLVKKQNHKEYFAR